MIDELKLDFSGLFSIAEEKPRAETPQDGLLEAEEYKPPQKDKSPAEGQEMGLKAIQREIDQNRAEKARCIEVYKKYQANTVKSAQLQSEILKGAKAGEDIYSLFLKAAEAISIMTGNPLFYSTLQEDIIAIYGAGLLEAQPLKIELEAVEGRLHKLKAARARGEPDYCQPNIAKAIQAHEQRAKQIRAELAKGGGA